MAAAGTLGSISRCAERWR